MFVYPYSPGNTIALDYFVENVLLCHRGMSQIIIDLLFTNKSDQEIDKVYLLFPYKIQNVYYNEKEDKYKYRPLGRFKDITKTFLDASSEFNNLCNPITKIKSGPARNPSSKTIIIDTPNLLSPFINVQYTGEIKGRSSISLLDNLDAYKTKILHDIDFSVFACNFKTPITLNEARWVRWNICPNNTSKNSYTRNQYLKKWLTNEINLKYEVHGPLNIKEMFLTRLECFITECNLSNENSELEKHALELKELIVNRGYNSQNTNTILTDCRLNLFPHDFQELNNVILTGDVNLGYTYNSLKRPINQYKSGSRNVKFIYDGLFSIKFEAKHRSKIISFLPILSIALAIIGIIIALFV